MFALIEANVMLHFYAYKIDAAVLQLSIGMEQIVYNVRWMYIVINLNIFLKRIRSEKLEFFLGNFLISHFLEC